MLAVLTLEPLELKLKADRLMCYSILNNFINISVDAANSVREINDQSGHVDWILIKIVRLLLFKRHVT